MKRSTLLSIDAFSRAENDVRIRTKSGAIITIVCFFVTVLLLVNEWFQFKTIITKPNLVIDRERHIQLELNIDVTFPSMPCDLLSLDIVDNTGVLLLDVTSTGFTKTRLDSSGQTIDSKSFNLDDDVSEYPPTDANYCGDCYGARDQTQNDKLSEEGKEKICCQTCDDVRNAYLEAGWAFFDGKKIEQCEREGYVERINERLNEGCRVQGQALINKIEGNIHFAPGKTFQSAYGHYHDTSLYDKSPNLNFNHIINHLSFGKPIVNEIANSRGATESTTPLDGQQYFPSYDSHGYTFGYFAKIVPTRYEYLDGVTVETAQFSASFHPKPIGGGPTDDEPSVTHVRGGIPGLFVFFEMSPLKVINREQHKLSWSGFFLNCITSIGGILAVGTVCDKIFYKAQRTFFQGKKE